MGFKDDNSVVRHLEEIETRKIPSMVKVRILVTYCVKYLPLPVFIALSIIPPRKDFDVKYINKYLRNHMICLSFWLRILRFGYRASKELL